MYKRAFDAVQERLKIVTKWDDFVPTLDAKSVVVMPWCEVESCEDDIKERSGKSYVFTSTLCHPNFSWCSANTYISSIHYSSEPTDERAPSAGAKSLAIPFDQKRWGEIKPGTKCPACDRDAKRWTMFGRSY